MSSNSSSSSSGIGLCGAIFIVFLVLKLCKVIAWSWWWVTAPLWIPAGIIAVALIVLFIVVLLTHLLKGH